MADTFNEQQDVRNGGAPNLLRVEQRVQRRSDCDNVFINVEVAGVCEPAERVLDRIHSALASHAELKSIYGIVRDSANDNIEGFGKVQDALQTTTEAMANIKSFLDACVGSFPASMRPTAQSHIIADKVLSTPELVEAILLYLSPRELLNAIQFNSNVLRIFLASGKLLDQLQLRSHKDGFFSNIISDRFEGLRVEVNGSSGGVSDLTFCDPIT